MKKGIVLSVLFMFFLLNQNVILAKSDKSNKSKNKTTHVKKQKSEDARKNWGQMKKDIENNPEFEGMSKKEIKETIKFEKRIRKIARNNEEEITDIETFIDQVLDGTIDLSSYNFSEKDLAKLEKEKSKYDKSMAKLAADTLTGDAPTGDAPTGDAPTGDAI